MTGALSGDGPGRRATEPGGWFVCARPRPRARARLFVFPHAGAGPAAVDPLAEALPERIEVWALNLPGRQLRATEPPRTEIGPLVREIAADRVPGAGPAHSALFGYCGGALLAHLVAGIAPPQRLFVGSYEAPDVAAVPRRMHFLPSERFWDVVLAEGGVGPELARHTDLREVFEPALRADFAVYAGYRHRAAPPRTVPITVLHGRDDPHLGRGGLLGWRRQSTTPPALRELAAGHWLLDEDLAGVAAALTEAVDADLRAARQPETVP